MKILTTLLLLATTTLCMAAGKLSLKAPVLNAHFSSLPPRAVTLTVTLPTKDAVAYEVQRKSGRVIRRWRTVGNFTPAQLEWADVNPPPHSKWRVRAFGSMGRSPFSNTIP